jgi:hypothetical protein
MIVLWKVVGLSWLIAIGLVALANATSGGVVAISSVNEVANFLAFDILRPLLIAATGTLALISAIQWVSTRLKQAR